MDYTYDITGRTSKDKFVNAGVGSLGFVITHFISKYPKFKGKAVVYKKYGTSKDGLFTNRFHDKEIIMTFTSTKELKELMKQPESFKDVLEEFNQLVEDGFIQDS